MFHDDMMIIIIVVIQATSREGDEVISGFNIRTSAIIPNPQRKQPLGEGKSWPASRASARS
jgi:hypothetical protein